MMISQFAALKNQRPFRVTFLAEGLEKPAHSREHDLGPGHFPTTLGMVIPTIFIGVDQFPLHVCSAPETIVW
jgi:hypothetical protein